MPFTAKQGQYLAFIFYYTKIHGLAPAESDMQNYFKVSPPSVHQMVVTLEVKGLIERVPGRGRSIRLLVPGRTCRIWNRDLPHVQQSAQLLSDSRFLARYISGELVLIEDLPDTSQESRQLLCEFGLMFRFPGKR